MLVELSVMEQRYHAVMEVVSGAPVTEVARRYGVSRQAVHGWLSRYEREGLAGLADHSHRPRFQPWQVDAQIEALICQLRGTHPRWGPRRLLYELGKARVNRLPSRSTIYRVLVRHGLVPARKRKRRRQDYKRWQREEPMQLWQLDVTGSVFLVDGTECKLISGLDDCSRFCVIATVVRRATGRAVCRAFVAAMVAYGIPDEVLTDNGKVFTGRFGKPRPAEVLFERICRRNGIKQLLAKPYSPTTIGKVERWHQSLQTDFLNDAGPFAAIEEAQAAVDAWRREYNHDRPHQSLGMATPASRFRPRPPEADDGLSLWAPADLEPLASPPAAPEHAAAAAEPASWPDAVEVDRIVPPSGNMTVGPQQFWLGTARAGQKVTVWIDTTTCHLSAGGWRIKTVPSRLSEVDLARLRRADGRPAGPPPAGPSPGVLAASRCVEVDRLVTGTGGVTLGNRLILVGSPLAGQRARIRLDGQLMHVITQDGLLWRTLPCPIPPGQRHRLQGVRLAGPAPLPVATATVQRRVSSRGGIQVARQKIQVGMTHAGKIVTVIPGDTSFRLVIDGEDVGVVPRTTSREIDRYKAYATHPGRR
ncbi:MAG: IS481 family transposase [Streptosporangiaceae bacterium]|nr:IS481 family transposase [Streptosporangiaceae bacterium]